MFSFYLFLDNEYYIPCLIKNSFCKDISFYYTIFNIYENILSVCVNY